MKFKKFTFNLPPDAADAFPELYVHGRGQDPRGPDIPAWEKAEAERVARIEARRREKQAEQAAKPEAAE